MKKKNKPEMAKNKIEINPKLPGDRDPIVPTEFDVSRASPVTEALSVIQRIHRAQVMKRIQPRLKQARKIAASRIATEDKIKKRAMIKARNILRNRMVGRTGISYQDMDPGQKIRIDAELEKRVKLIRRIAQRIIPQVRKAERERFSSFTHKDMINHGQHGTPSKIQFAEAYDKLDGAEDQEHTTRYKKVIIVGRDGKKRTVTRAVNVKSLEEKALDALSEKSIKSGIPMEEIIIQFQKGLNEHNTSKYLHLSPNQYAFACVNKYISENCSPVVRRFRKKISNA